jgi:single-stranded-DNA-specific exonuclease
MKCRWTIAPPQAALGERLAGELRLSPLLAKCLLNRGLSEADSADAFLNPRLARLADPFLLPDMEVAVTRLNRARAEKTPIVIFGDYDVDGVTSSALLKEVLTALGWQVECYLPHRLDEGYGLSREGVENCLRKFPTRLLLAVDCGSTAVDTVAWLRERGVDVIVLDHHQVSSPAPAATALVNPQLAAADQPSFRELCSVGLAFKLAHALVKWGRQQRWSQAEGFDIRPFLDLVALGTIADLVPLRGENRTLVATGLAGLNRTRRPGLLALKNVAQINSPIGVYEVGFQLAPRLNAAGRLENAEQALELLLERDPARAEPLARRLDSSNRERQAIERGIFEQVRGAVQARFNPATDYVIVEGQMLWHVGVVGIVAARVLRQFYRPTLILGGEGDEWRGSGRSIEGFDLAAALRECDDLLLRHGGHALAAGLSLRPDCLDALRQRLNGLARRTLKPEQLQPSLLLDVETDCATLTLERLEELAALGPHGQGNPPVQLALRGVRLQRPPQRMGAARQHIRFSVTDGVASHDVVWWRAEDAPLPDGTFDLAVEPQINEFNGRRSVQLKLLDWRPAA